MVGYPGQEPAQVTRVEGDILSKKIKAVCVGCNGGWMSRLETAIRPLLTPLILGEPFLLTPDKYRVIQIWATMKAIVGEMDDPTRRAIPPNSAVQFYRTRNLLMASKLWIGSYTGSTWSTNAQYTHGGGTGVPGVYFQTSTFCIGHLYLHFATTSNPFQGYCLYEPADTMLVEIPTSADIAWPRLNGINDAHAEKIANWIYDPRRVASWV